MEVYRSFARERVCEFRQEPDGRVYLLGQLSSKKTYVIERKHATECPHETFRYEDVLDLATYSPHLPSFIWTVYARALFLQDVCWIRSARILPSRSVDCDVSRPSILLPFRHQGLAWFKPILRQTQAQFPALIAKDDDRFSQESSNSSSNTCFESCACRAGMVSFVHVREVVSYHQNGAETPGWWTWQVFLCDSGTWSNSPVGT